MKPDKRGNPFGGSAGGGGYDFQAEAYALVSSKILAQESLNWVETGCDRVPVSVRMETGSGGDDLQIILRQGAKIELQAKRGLVRGDDLWTALTALAQAINADTNTYGVLLTNTGTSRTIREDLKEGIIKVGQGIKDDLPEIVQDFLGRVQAGALDELAICSHLRIVIRDLDPGSQGEAETLGTLRGVVADSKMAEAARNTLVSDGHDLIKLRGSRDSASIARILQQSGIQLSVLTTNQLVLREAFVIWSVQVNETISIPSLNVALPMSNAWIRLRAMAPQGAEDASKSVEEQIKHYYEWHRLADSDYSLDTIGIEAIAHDERLVVVIGGPGSGKSTLLRRLARSWSRDGRLVLRVSLQAVALRTSKGETFDEAILAVASEGFPGDSKTLFDLLRGASYLLADGLDETDPNRSGIAEKLQRWALADKTRHVILTTRPMGHNPAWFEGWEHFELLPLGQSDISKFAQIIFDLVYSNDPQHAKQMSNAFLEELKRARTASVAARNPQLLGFLIALYINGRNISGTRYQLLGSVVEEIRRQTTPDRAFRHEVDTPTARHGIECLGWLMLDNPFLSEDELVQNLGQQLATDFALSSVQGEQRASNVLSFWEERGLLEHLRVGNSTAFVFVHLMFQDFGAARYLARLPEDEFVRLVCSKRNILKFRETLLLVGGTRRLALAVTSLLKLDDPSDPVSVDAFLAADILAEAEKVPADLQNHVFRHLAPRLTCKVPMVAYEAGERLKPLAITNPSLIGPKALELAKHEQQWTREIGCALGLLSGDDYVDVNVLLAVFPMASDTTITPGPSGLALNHWPLMRTLLIKGAEKLLADKAPTQHLDVVKAQYQSGHHSLLVASALYHILELHLSSEESEAVRPQWLKYDYLKSTELQKQADQEANQALLEALVVASKGLTDDGMVSAPDSKMRSIVRLWQILDIGENSASEFYVLGQRHLQDELIEVLRGAILVISLMPSQVRADAEEALRDLTRFQNRFYELLVDSGGYKAKPDLDWTLAQNQCLRSTLLLQAMSHPCWFVCRFAMMLLWECTDRGTTRAGLKEVLANGVGHSLSIIAQVASEVWTDEAASLVLNRLEQKLTDDCVPLVEALGEICGEPSKQRAKSLLENILAIRNAAMVHAALVAVDKLDLDEALITAIEASYHWWLHDGRQGPSRGTGVVPESAAAALLSRLVRMEKIGFEKILEAFNAGHPDVRSVAIKATCQFLEKRDDLVEPILADIGQGKLSNSLIRELSQSHSTVCRKHFASFMRLLDSDDKMVQLASIRALGDGWVEYDEVANRLRSLLDAPDMRIRNETTKILRRLNVSHST